MPGSSYVLIQTVSQINTSTCFSTYMSLHVSNHKMSRLGRRDGYLIISSDLMRRNVADLQTRSSQIAFWEQLL